MNAKPVSTSKTLRKRGQSCFHKTEKFWRAQHFVYFI